ncbi:hypothetical protein [Dethiobacter alkaliphilus]|uniref:Uncharacterized protein n=1 Tax=Dethiobacter alkaliphilus AHT 1 TaxID=555088 RepID=C0GI21_DETAL|nr:hypothetical protein [Dethiobacter alkaliphilus]EEG77095.1 hypothetical protein DealDRAFT_2130 [Dethiobacter alkaliphilus AHT 1]
MNNASVKKISLILIILGLVSFGFMQFRENQRYRRYLSHELQNDLSKLAWATILHGFLLDEVVNEQQITHEQVLNIQSKVRDISSRGYKVALLANYYLKLLGSSDYSNSPYPYYMATDFSYHLNRPEWDGVFEEEETYQLDEDMLKKFELMKEINDVWVDAITTHINGIHIPSAANVKDGGVVGDGPEITTDEYWDTYRKNFIKNKDWVDMLEQKQRESKIFEADVKNIF